MRRSPLLSVAVGPFRSGDTPLQHYNSLLTLSYLQVCARRHRIGRRNCSVIAAPFMSRGCVRGAQTYADAVVYFSNDDLMARAMAAKTAMPGYRKGDDLRCGTTAAVPYRARALPYPTMHNRRSLTPADARRLDAARDGCRAQDIDAGHERGGDADAGAAAVPDDGRRRHRAVAPLVVAVLDARAGGGALSRRPHAVHRRACGGGEHVGLWTATGAGGTGAEAAGSTASTARTTKQGREGSRDGGEWRCGTCARTWWWWWWQR
jgi:hypothetical protein